jgi:septal ring factor EnvC (AmiA/AmiB activator)
LDAENRDLRDKTSAIEAQLEASVEELAQKNERADASDRKAKALGAENKKLGARTSALEAQLEATVKDLAKRDKRATALKAAANKRWRFVGKIKSMRKRPRAAGKKEEEVDRRI